MACKHFSLTTAMCAFALALAAADNTVGISHVDSRYFEDESGRTWVPIGCNICFERLNLPRDEARTKFDGWMTALARNGGNYMRVWLGARWTDIMTEKAYVFNRDAEENLAWIVRRAEELGLKLKLTLEHFRATKPVPADQVRNPGSACQDGFDPFTKTLYWSYAKDMGEFFRSKECFAIYLAKAARVAELVGKSPALMAVETWNEINATGASMDDIGAWSDKMHEELRKLFPGKMILMDLGSFADAHDGLWYDFLSRQKGCDYLQVHRYREPGAMLDIVARGQVDQLCADAIRELLDRDPSRPAILAETGATERWHSDVSHFYALDEKGMILHDVIFAPFFAGSAGSGQAWHWDHQYISRHNLWWHFGRFAKAVKGLDPAREHFRPFHSETRRMRIWGLEGERTIVAWCRDKENTLESELDGGRKPRPVAGEKLPGIWTGGGTVSWYLPWEDRSLVVKGRDVPEFSRSAVFRATKAAGAGR